jgi:hypothetical protein
MPVLTCPFALLPASELTAGERGYPGKSFRTELAIKPTAGEVWSVEGLTLSLTQNYTLEYFVTTKIENTALKKSLTFLKESLKYIEKSLTFLKEQYSVLEAIYGEAGKTAKENAVNVAERYGISSSEEGAKHEIEATRNEIETVEKELKILGKVQANEGVEKNPITILANLYARGNELVWNTQLSPLRIVSMRGETIVEGSFTRAENTITEALDFHVQFDDPIDFTERENLTLELTFIGPPGGIIVEQGALIPESSKLKVSQVRTIVNYSRQVPS